MLNYLLPLRGVLSMHCSANIGAGGDTALFFGLSGTGKTTLSSDPERQLIGDDEHGWSDRGVFNFEGGCYAKMIRLSAGGRAADLRHDAPLRHRARERGDRSGHARAELRRCVADREHARRVPDRVHRQRRAVAAPAAIPQNIVMLTADAYGVLPPIARLSAEGAMYHFLSGYTAKVAGTEKGVTEPSATFSTCFGAPFLPLNPNVYAQAARRAHREAPARGCGWSTPAGPAGRTASAAA